MYKMFYGVIAQTLRYLLFRRAYYSEMPHIIHPATSSWKRRIVINFYYVYLSIFALRLAVVAYLLESENISHIEAYYCLDSLLHSGYLSGVTPSFMYSTGVPLVFTAMIFHYLIHYEWPQQPYQRIWSALSEL